jgi:hypothetical protein
MAPATRRRPRPRAHRLINELVAAGARSVAATSIRDKRGDAVDEVAALHEFLSDSLA